MILYFCFFFKGVWIDVEGFLIIILIDLIVFKKISLVICFKLSCYSIFFLYLMNFSLSYVNELEM